MNKKRVRGMKRHLRSHQQRAAVPELIDEDRMGKLHYDYAKLGLSPWRGNGKPPVAIRKLWVSRLVTNFHRWHEQLMARYDDFYLAIWIIDTVFGESQLVAAVGDRKARYEKLFGETLDRPLPREYATLPGLAELQWTAKANIEIEWPEGFAKLGSRGLKRPHWSVEGADGELLLAVQSGVVWVGEKA